MTSCILELDRNGERQDRVKVRDEDKNFNGPVPLF
jgi:hypothetical protein